MIEHISRLRTINAKYVDYVSFFLSCLCEFIDVLDYIRLFIQILPLAFF